MIYTRAYWRAASERAISAGAAAATAGVTIDATNGFDASAIRTAALAFCVGAAFSIVKGLAANAANGGLGPGVGDAETTAPAIVLPDEDGTPRGDLGDTPPDDPHAAVTPAPGPVAFAALPVADGDDWAPPGYAAPTYQDTEPLDGRPETRRAR